MNKKGNAIMQLLSSPALSRSCRLIISAYYQTAGNSSRAWNAVLEHPTAVAEETQDPDNNKHWLTSNRGWYRPLAVASAPLERVCQTHSYSHGKEEHLYTAPLCTGSPNGLLYLPRRACKLIFHPANQPRSHICETREPFPWPSLTQNEKSACTKTLGNMFVLQQLMAAELLWSLSCWPSFIHYP